tara:strand:- start:137 stop:376 length:240 start_codon:yes stop_codon:yes gene_type:complete
MKKIFTIIALSVINCNIVKAETANCTGGECEFDFSNHYKYATTICLQTLSYEPVKTDLLSFTILETGQECKVIESSRDD